MSYSVEWYDNYRKQLLEPSVRRTHDKMFRLFGNFENEFYQPRDIIDLGCATQEFYQYDVHHNKYFGIDLNHIERERNAILGDYTKVNLTDICSFIPNTFVSIFSTEIIMSAADKYKFYERIFKENASIEFGLVSGFYYKGKEQDETLIETSGGYNDIVYQTVEDQMYYQSEVFEEWRTYIDVPSEMFGNLVEVWKILSRKK